jgi:hypothetical protein
VNSGNVVPHTTTLFWNIHESIHKLYLLLPCTIPKKYFRYDLLAIYFLSTMYFAIPVFTHNAHFKRDLKKKGM